MFHSADKLFHLSNHGPVSVQWRRLDNQRFHAQVRKLKAVGSQEQSEGEAGFTGNEKIVNTPNGHF